MKLNYLFPHRYKKAAWIVFVPSVIFGFCVVAFDITPDFLQGNVWALFADPVFGSEEHKKFFSVTNNNLLDEIMGVLIIVSGLVVSFSKEKIEDELIQKIRLESLVWATYLNYGILLLAIIFVYDMSFLWVMIFNLFTIILFFIIRFNWQVSKLKKTLVYEE